MIRRLMNGRKYLILAVLHGTALLHFPSITRFRGHCDDDNALKDFWEYDPGSDKWTKKLSWLEENVVTL